ncbi:hypothetical protein ALQ04_00245 [Pseudomonas cichorii]|uniref:DUF3077 domain-containing protein n=1 Tax=Pseudomonas cichorii TaxID=36746 RepID=A0A3M4M7J4_PSECI|nr:DUF3077 domain-containing protein [Pseudomonas cichorii]RMQ49224.1 hypothetical protein ALQ04_00245 [Pseudomonas cichorii]
MVKKLVPDPPVFSLSSRGSTIDCHETQLAHVSDLLRCAGATVYEGGDALNGQQRDLIMASMHLISQAQGVIDQMLDRMSQSTR